MVLIPALPRPTFRASSARAWALAPLPETMRAFAASLNSNETTLAERQGAPRPPRSLALSSWRDDERLQFPQSRHAAYRQLVLTSRATAQRFAAPAETPHEDAPPWEANPGRRFSKYARYNPMKTSIDPQKPGHQIGIPGFSIKM